MDKPLSQERLSEGNLANHIGWLAIGLDSKGYERLQIIVNEIKRLQAIEQQNEELRKVIDRQHIQLEKYETIFNGGIDHE